MKAFARYLLSILLALAAGLVPVANDAASAADAQTTLKIVLVGDSTVTDGSG